MRTLFLMPVRHAHNSIRIMALAVVAGLLLACSFHSVMSWLGFSYPWTTFLYDPADRFNDWYNAVASAATGDPYRIKLVAVAPYFPWTYTALLVGDVASPVWSLVIYLGLSLVFALTGITLMWRFSALPGRGEPTRFPGDLLRVCVICFLSYPVIFTLDRGSIDLWIASACLIFTALLKTRYALIGFMLLALAIALKGYPLAFITLALFERRYHQTFFCLALATLLTTFALAGMPGTLADNFGAWMSSLNRYYEVYVVGNGSLHASADPYNAVRLVLLFLTNRLGWLGTPVTTVQELIVFSVPILKAYSYVSFSFAMICTVFVLFVPAAGWRKIMAVCLLAILFPNVAADYKLTILLPGAIALLAHYDPAEWRDRCALLCVAALFIPKNYVFVQGIGLSVVISPLILLVLAYVVLADRPAWAKALSTARQWRIRPRRAAR